MYGDQFGEFVTMWILGLKGLIDEKVKDQLSHVCGRTSGFWLQSIPVKRETQLSLYQEPNFLQAIYLLLGFLATLSITKVK